MGFELVRAGHQQAILAASAVNPKQPVKLVGTSGLQVVPCGTNTDRPFGVVDATAGASGLNAQEYVTVYEELNIKKAIACASLGVGAEVAVGSSNGSLSPAALSSASGHWAVGVSMTAAAAGEVFSLYIRPRKA